eukprot:PhM_4_TR15948/c3_g2_i2/m.50217
MMTSNNHNANPLSRPIGQKADGPGSAKPSMASTLQSEPSRNAHIPIANQQKPKNNNNNNNNNVAKKVMLAPGIEATQRQASLLRSWTGPGYWAPPPQIPASCAALGSSGRHRSAIPWQLRHER